MKERKIRQILIAVNFSFKNIKLNKITMIGFKFKTIAKVDKGRIPVAVKPVNIPRANESPQTIVTSNNLFVRGYKMNFFLLNEITFGD
jgi:hypothetical protein